MKVQSFALSDVGLVRRENQDTCGHFPESNLFVVADGMGGHAGGKQASEMAVATIEECVAAATQPMEGYDLDQVVVRFLDAVKIANQRIVDRAASDTGLHKMGTTLVALLLDGRGGGAIVHIGDSRAYRLRGDDLELLTTDHTLVSDLLRNREISEVEASAHPYRHVLTRALGSADDAAAEVKKIEVTADDLYVLCTDGISGMVPTEHLKELTAAHRTDPERLCRELIAAANAAGGKDNSTVIAVRLVRD